MTDEKRDEGMPELRLIRGNFQIQRQLSLPQHPPHMLTISEQIFIDDTPEQVNERLDAAHAAIERQALRAELRNKEEQVRQMIEHMESYKRQLEDLDVKVKSYVPVGLSADAPRPKLSSTQKLQMDREKEQLAKGWESIRGIKKSVEEINLSIESTRAKLASAA